MASITVRVGKAKDLNNTQGRAVGITMKAIAQEIVERVQDRTDDHPASHTLRVKGVNQYTALIEGSRGGPGIILPVKRKALWWEGLPHPVASAYGPGFEPLMKAEAGRIQVLNINAVVP